MLSVAAVLVVGMIPTPVLAQDDGVEVVEEIRGALQEGDPERLVRASSARMDVTILGTSELLSRSQAKYVVKSFFAEYPPVEVEIVDTSQSNGNWFASAAYWYETGAEPLSIYVRLRNRSGEWELRELRIDRTPPR